MRIVVKGDLQNKELVGDTWSPTAFMITLRYSFADVTKHKARAHQLNFIGAFLQEKFENRVLVKMDIRYPYYSPEYSVYFGRALILLKSMYGMTNYENLFDDELI